MASIKQKKVRWQQQTHQTALTFCRYFTLLLLFVSTSIWFNSFIVSVGFFLHKKKINAINFEF